jgi:hypothetical protein
MYLFHSFSEASPWSYAYGYHTAQAIQSRCFDADDRADKALFDESEKDIFADFRIYILDSFPKCIVIRINLSIQLSQSQRLKMLCVPILKSVNTHKMPIISEQLFKAHPGNIGQL